jgi:hypothetical protein
MMHTSAPSEAAPGERRRYARPRVNFECSWRRDAQVSDLSASGCYVDSRHVPVVGTRAEFEIELPGGPVTVHGIVRHGLFGVGFAVQFDELDYDTRVRIASVVNGGRIEHVV